MFNICKQEKEEQPPNVIRNYILGNWLNTNSKMVNHKYQIQTAIILDGIFSILGDYIVIRLNLDLDRYIKGKLNDPIKIHLFSNNHS